MLRKLAPFAAGVVGLGLLGLLGGLLWRGSQTAPRHRGAVAKLDDGLDATELRAVPLPRGEPPPLPSVAVVEEPKPKQPRATAAAGTLPRPEPERTPEPAAEPPPPERAPPQRERPRERSPEPQREPEPPRETEPPRAPEPPPPPRRSEPTGPVDLPETATPPRPDGGNRAPEFPEAARARALEGDVILKIVVTEGGSVGRVEVLRGTEPFIAAAREAVQAWRYTPALLDGRPIAVYKIVKVPFRLAGLR